MKIVIDAWLERKDPQLRFLDSENASVVMQLDTALTRNLLERGEIDVDDLRNPLNHDLAKFIFGTVPKEFF
jgi:hypothetical protein